MCVLLTGYIDLSKRRVSPEEIQKCEEKYSKAKTVSLLARSMKSAAIGLTVHYKYFVVCFNYVSRWLIVGLQ